MRKLILIFIFSLFFFNINIAKERSKIEIKNGVFLEDLKNIGKFKKINKAPSGMFKKDNSTFHEMAKYSQKKIGLIFITQKGLMDKYPENLMLGLGYFEFFYMQQLKENAKHLKKFKSSYPKVGPTTKDAVKKMYGLNKVRKTMRNALGFKIEDDVQDVLNTYYTLNKLFSQGEKVKKKLTKDEKKISKIHNNLIKHIGTAKNLATDKKEKRIEKKKFKKDYKKIIKKIDAEFKKLENKEIYTEIKKIKNLVKESEIENEKVLESMYNLMEFLMSEVKIQQIKKKYEIDLSKADFTNFTQDELIILGEVSLATKKIKAEKINEIQIDIFNLENNNLPVNKILDNIRNNYVDLSSINFQMVSANEMNLWAAKEWSNAWKTPILEKAQTSDSILIDLSNDEIEQVKAQLAIRNFKDIMGGTLTDELRDALKDIDNTLGKNPFKFTYNLDHYASFLSDTYNLSINNYAQLTNLANQIYNENWTVEEYKSAYQLNVDAINALASGTSSFEVASVAQSLGATLQDVADTIAAASAQGIAVDLEAAAAGLGYGSFADAVAAYNAQHGTSYTPAQAEQALKGE